MCPVGTGAHRDTGTGSPRAGGPRGQHGEVQGQVSPGTLPTHCEVLLALCPLPRSDINSVTEVESHSHPGRPDVSVLYLVARPRYCCCVEGFWHPCLKQVYWRHFPRSVCSLCVSASWFGNCCSISNAPPAKR